MTSQDVINRLRPHFENAVKNHTGVSYLLSTEESAVFGEAELAQLKAETGFPAPAPVYLTRFQPS